MKNVCLWMWKGKDEDANKKIYCVEEICYRIFLNPERSYIFYKALVAFIICSKSDIITIEYLKKKKGTEILKITGYKLQLFI